MAAFGVILSDLQRVQGTIGHALAGRQQRPAGVGSVWSKNYVADRITRATAMAKL